jgi:UDP-GlcNAc:undecaprenyl-phosphate/decaprenyl-phosphate GlcNAc-1-phosphate transferase
MMTYYGIAILILLGFTSGLIFTPLAIAVSKRFKLFDKPGLHKRHKQPVPILGGTALLFSVWTAVIWGRFIFPGMGEFDHYLPYVLAGSLIVYGVGLLDDFKPQRAWVKLIAQIIAGLILFWGGLRIDPVSVPFMGPISVGPFSILITVVWVALLTNGINLIDGLDGLASGVSLVAAITLSLVGHLYHADDALVLAYAMAGFLAAFLIYNRYPAKIFLGDSGSLQIGYYFAVLSLAVPLKSFTAAALYLPLLALGVPIIETTSSFVRRLAAGRNVMQADRRHLFHYLSLAGLTPRQIVWIFYLLSALLGGFALAMFFWDRILVFTALVLFMVVIFGWFLIFTSSLSRRKRKSSGANSLR